ncbi:MAG: type II toxin-antitoxin system HicA family toxin [Candidatus Promineifilaceae bacterium]
MVSFLARVRGSHHIFEHPRIPEILNLQNHKGQVKPYQVRQFLQLIEQYNLELED